MGSCSEDLLEIQDLNSAPAAEDTSGGERADFWHGLQCQFKRFESWMCLWVISKSNKAWGASLKKMKREISSCRARVMSCLFAVIAIRRFQMCQEGCKVFHLAHAMSILGESE